MKRSIRIDSAELILYRDTEPGFVLPGEARSTAKLTWVEGGKLHSVADGKDILLSPGELVVYRPGQWHVQYADMEDVPRFCSLAFDSGSLDLSCLTDRKIPLSPGVDALLKQILREQPSEPYAADMILASLELAVLTLLRQYGALEAAAAPQAENEIIRRAQQYVCAHVREKLTVPLVARKADVSPSYLTALFHKHLGISPGEFIRRVKLQESKALIKAGNMNFTEIAAALNYSTVHHFSRQFKDKFGITPTEYAKSVRKP